MTGRKAQKALVTQLHTAEGDEKTQLLGFQQRLLPSASHHDNDIKSDSKLGGKVNELSPGSECEVSGKCQVELCKG